MLQVVQESVYNYSMFIQTVTNMVKEMMGEEYSIQIYKIMKNNSLELDSMVILKKGDKISPNIYLMPYYEEYMQGTGVEVLAKKLCSVYCNNLVPTLNEDFLFSFDRLKTFLIYRLVSYDRKSKICL